MGVTDKILENIVSSMVIKIGTYETFLSQL